MNRVLIFAGGKGTRMKSENNVPKQFMKINDKYIIIHTLEKFERCPDIDDIVVVCLQGWIDELESSVKEAGLKKVSKIVPGGLTGFDSRLNGLDALADSETYDEDIVLIHDGVRPFIPSDIITENINCAKRTGNAITVAPLNETLIYTATNPDSMFQRSNCFLARAPQTFFVKKIHELYKRALSENKTELIDSATIAYHYGESLNYVVGPEENIKITTPLDYHLATAIIQSSDSNLKDLK